MADQKKNEELFSQMKDGLYYTQKDIECFSQPASQSQDDTNIETQPDNGDVSGCTQFWNDVVNSCDKAQEQQV